MKMRNLFCLERSKYFKIVILMLIKVLKKLIFLAPKALYLWCQTVCIFLQLAFSLSINDDVRWHRVCSNDTGSSCSIIVTATAHSLIRVCVLSRSVMSSSLWPHGLQPARPLRPWDSPGKKTGVGCHFLLQCMKVKSEREVTRPCPTLSDPLDCSPSGSSVHGIFQARGLEWGATALWAAQHN